MKTRMKTRTLLLTAALAAFSSRAEVKFRNNVAGTGYWDDPANWPNSTLPTASDDVQIGANQTAIITNGVTVQVKTINIKAYAGSHGTLRIDGGTINNTVINVGTEKTLAEVGENTAVLEVNDGTIYSSNTSETGRQKLTIGSAGHLIQNGGTVKPYDMTVSGLYDHVGGTNAVTGAAVYIQVATTENTGYHPHAGAVVTGVIAYNVPGGVIDEACDLSSATVEVPNGGRTTGSLEFRDVPDITVGKLWPTYHSSGRQSMTGTVSFVRSSVTVSAMPDEQNYSSITGISKAEIFLDASTNLLKSYTIFAGSSDDVAAGRTRFRVAVTNGSLLAAGAALPVTSGNGKAIALGRASHLFVDDGTVCAQYLRAGPGSHIELVSGTIKAWGLIDAGGTASEPALIEVKGGLFNIAPGSKSFALGGDGTATAGNSVVLRQTGGTVDPSNSEIILGSALTSGYGRYELAGGTLAPNSYIRVKAGGCGEFSIQGASPVATTKQINAGDYDFLMEYVLMREAPHIATLEMSRKGCRCGHLRVRLDGGVLLTTANEFALLRATGTTTLLNGDVPNHDYSSYPNAALWNTTLSADSRTAGVSFTAPLTTLASRTTYAPATPASAGSVTLAPGRASNILSAAVKLALTAPDGTALSAEALAAFADALTEAGYEGSAVLDNDPNYQLRVELPPAGFSADGTPVRFAWDFSEAPSIRAISAAIAANEDTAPAATALVTGLSFDARIANESTTILFR